MTALKIQNFGGVSPRTSDRLLNDNQAVTAYNAKLYSGELRGLHETNLLYDFNPSNPPNPITRAFRLPASVNAPIPIGDADEWIGFSDPNVDFVRTPVLEDSFERYYWTSDSTYLSGVPQYSTRARINANNASPGSAVPFALGINAPINAPVVTPAAGTNLVRAYIYTFVSAYGEESSPSLPTTATGTNGTWTLSDFDSTNPSSTYYNAALVSPNSNITTIRIYRTVAGSNGSTTSYYHVGDVAVGSAPTFTDNYNDATVALNYTVPSINWGPPPATLKGIIAHPGGFLVGFSGRDLWLSEPYQPHAWPVEYIQTCQTEIVGVAIFNNCIIVTTTSHPYVGTGMAPLSLTLLKLDSIDPCVSRRSIVTTLAGVFYASPQGIVMNDSTQSQLVTFNLFTREEWQEQFSPTTVYAAPYGLQYIAFDTTATGFIYSPSEQLAPLTTLDRFNGVEAIQIDAYSGDVYLVQNNQCNLWDPPDSIPYEYTWTSKEFDLPDPVNFGAFRIKFDANPVQVSAASLAKYEAFNAARIAKPLNPINGCAINGVRKMTIAASVSVDPQNHGGAIAGSPLYNIAALTTPAVAVTFTAYARNLDSEWVAQYTNTVTNEGIYKMPAGFKSDVWQFEFIGNTNVYSFAVAGNANELKKV